MDLFGFPPAPARTAAIDLGIRRALGESVARVLGEAARLGFVRDGDVAGWEAALLATRRAPPQLWACYHDLVQAILRSDAEAVPALAADMLARGSASEGRAGTVLTITENDLGAVDAARYRAIIDGDPTRPLGLRPASAADVARLADLAVQARELLAETDTALLDEIDTLGHQIVLATGADGGFGGAASVFLWGAVILNPVRVPDRVTLVESLAHETAHALLFGLTLGADLTTNDPTERYGSPLRPDPRPIEGIVHATYVLARMNHALGRLRRSVALSQAERALIVQKLARNRASYGAGLTTVDTHAHFTPEGAAIFQACRNAMAIGRHDFEA